VTRWAQTLNQTTRTDAAPDAFDEQFDITRTAKRLEAFYLEQA